MYLYMCVNLRVSQSGNNFNIGHKSKIYDDIFRPGDIFPILLADDSSDPDPNIFGVYTNHIGGHDICRGHHKEGSGLQYTRITRGFNTFCRLETRCRVLDLDSVQK